MLFTAENLQDKTRSDVKQVLQASVEYLLTKVCLEYVTINSGRFATVRDFNEKNHIYFTNTLLYPFLVSLSNVHSRSLFNLYGGFYAFDFGPISLHVFKLINNSEPEAGALKHFLMTAAGRFNLVATEAEGELPVAEKLNKIAEAIKQTPIKVAGEAIAFDNIKIVSDIGTESSLYLAIESGIKAIKEQNDIFFNVEPEVLKLHASYAFKKRYVTDERASISYDDIEEVERRPFYKYEA